MEQRLVDMREKMRNGYYAKAKGREPLDIQKVVDVDAIPWHRQVAMLLELMCIQEQPTIDDDEKIVFRRQMPHPINPIPKAFLEEEAKEGKRLIGYRVHNITPDWGMVLAHGLDGRRNSVLLARRKYGADFKRVEYLDSVIFSIDSVSRLVENYRHCAEKLGRDDIEAMLVHVPAQKPRSFREALQSLRILHGVLWMNGHNHVGLGRFDQYLWPYLKADKDVTPEMAKNFIAEFFISINKDADVLPGIQKGDNGQTLMLGGVTPDNRSAVNPLTYLVLEVAADICLIDPKINLRVDSSTDNELLAAAARLSAKGLGFPQFSNDDVVIPALIKQGYDPQDARDYCVAACWEFVIPGKGMDTPNINALSFASEVDDAIRDGLSKGRDFEYIMRRTKRNIEHRITEYIDDKANIRYYPPAPLFSAFMANCIESSQDVNNGGAKYYNYGIHGCGASNAADALAAVRKHVFTKSTVSGLELVRALERDWEGFAELRKKFRYESPKVGNDDDEVDELLVKLFEFFASACNKVTMKNHGPRRIRIRPGTGSAMYNVRLVQTERMPKQIEPNVGATADGRKKAECLSVNLSPTIGAPVRGPISVLKSFGKLGYADLSNGGPITIELNSGTFNSESGKKQIENLIRIFLFYGCQQMQLNIVSADELIKAQEDPAKYRNLVVRVWGWSGYFCELDSVYQDQIIARTFF